MKLERLKQIAAEMGVKPELHKLTGGRTGLHIPLERVDNGKACVVPIEDSAPLMRYLWRANAEWSYSGNYSGIMIMLPDDDQPEEGATT